MFWSCVGTTVLGLFSFNQTGTRLGASGPHPRKITNTGLSGMFDFEELEEVAHSAKPMSEACIPHVVISSFRVSFDGSSLKVVFGIKRSPRRNAVFSSRRCAEYTFLDHVLVVSN